MKLRPGAFISFHVYRFIAPHVPKNQNEMFPAFSLSFIVSHVAKLST